MFVVLIGDPFLIVMGNNVKYLSYVQHAQRLKNIRREWGLKGCCGSLRWIGKI